MYSACTPPPAVRWCASVTLPTAGRRLARILSSQAAAFGPDTSNLVIGVISTRPTALRTAWTSSATKFPLGVQRQLYWSLASTPLGANQLGISQPLSTPQTAPSSVNLS